jgi:hypothetical protein
MENANMQISKVSAVHGWNWVVAGFGLFRKLPAIWMLLFVVFMLISFLVSFIPVLGQLVMPLLWQVFLGSFMIASREVERDEDIDISILFSGFRHNPAQLVTLGGINLVGTIILVGMVMTLGGLSSLMPVLMGGVPPGDAAVAMEGVHGGTLIVLLLATLASTLLMMASWFAPALIVFNGCRTIEAMKLSFAACTMNMWAMLLFGMVSLILLIIAAIPYGLGLFVLGPVILASIYASYADIFPEAVGDGVGSADAESRPDF